MTTATKSRKRQGMPPGLPVITKLEHTYVTRCDQDMGYPILGPTDVKDYIKDYIEEYHKVPQSIILSPKNEKYAREAGDIPVFIMPGVARWEIWLQAPDDSIDSMRGENLLGEGQGLGPVTIPGEPPPTPPALPEPPPQPTKSLPAVNTPSAGSSVPPARKTGTPKAKASNNKGVVSKLPLNKQPQKRNIATKNSTNATPAPKLNNVSKLKAESFETPLKKHPGGRPRKQPGEPMSRMTRYRRRKEAQGVLL